MQKKKNHVAGAALSGALVVGAFPCAQTAGYIGSNMSVVVVILVVCAVAAIVALVVVNVARGRGSAHANDVAMLFRGHRNEGMMDDIPVITRADGTVADVGEVWWTDANGFEAVVSDGDFSYDAGDLGLMLDYHPTTHLIAGRHQKLIYSVCIPDTPEVEAAFLGVLEEPRYAVPLHMSKEPRADEKAIRDWVDAAHTEASVACATADTIKLPLASSRKVAEQPEGLGPNGGAHQGPSDPSASPARCRAKRAWSPMLRRANVAVAPATPARAVLVSGVKRAAVPVAAGLGIVVLVAVQLTRYHRSKDSN